VSRIAIRGAEDDARSPSRLSLRFSDGAKTSATIAPGMSKSVIVSWMPDKDPRVRQAFGHVVITSTDETAGEVAVGFRAQLPTGLGPIGDHALSLLVLWPLVAIAGVFVARLFGQHGDRVAPRVSIGVGIVQLALALWVHRHFAPDVGHLDGNDGFQLIERGVWVRAIGIEWYLGVDGASMPLVLLAAAVSLIAIGFASTQRRNDAHYAAVALTSAGIIGVLVALDMVLFFAAWQAVWLGLVLLVGASGGARCHAASAKLGVYAVIGSFALLVAFIALSRASGSSFLVDGTPVAHTMSIPELSRTSFAAKGELFGLPLVDTAWVLMLVAVAVATPIVPLHGWLPDVLDQGPASACILTAGAVVALGPYLLVRVGLGAVPEGARWAGASVAALGAFGAAWGALCAMVQPDLRRFVAYATISGGGVCLYGIGALTPEGIAGGGFALFAHGVASVLLLGVTVGIEQRVHTSDTTRLGDLSVETPVLALLMAVGLGVSAGVPGLVGSWGILLSLLGGFVRYPAIAVVVAGALVVSTAAHLRIARAVLLARANAPWRARADLVLFGGRLPDATWTEILALVPAATVALVLGIWPAPLLASIAVSARDCSALVDPTGPDPRTDVR